MEWYKEKEEIHKIQKKRNSFAYELVIIVHNSFISL